MLTAHLTHAQQTPSIQRCLWKRIILPKMSLVEMQNIEHLHNQYVNQYKSWFSRLEEKNRIKNTKPFWFRLQEFYKKNEKLNRSEKFTQSLDETYKACCLPICSLFVLPSTILFGIIYLLSFHYLIKLFKTDNQAGFKTFTLKFSISTQNEPSFINKIQVNFIGFCLSLFANFILITFLSVLVLAIMITTLAVTLVALPFVLVNRFLEPLKPLIKFMLASEMESLNLYNESKMILRDYEELYFLESLNTVLKKDPSLLINFLFEFTNTIIKETPKRAPAFADFFRSLLVEMNSNIESPHNLCFTYLSERNLDEAYLRSLCDKAFLNSMQINKAVKSYIHSFEQLDDSDVNIFKLLIMLETYLLITINYFEKYKQPFEKSDFFKNQIQFKLIGFHEKMKQRELDKENKLSENSQSFLGGKRNQPGNTVFAGATPGIR